MDPRMSGMPFGDARERSIEAKRLDRRQMVFDWVKAAHMLNSFKPAIASAGLAYDYGDTCGPIWRNGRPIRGGRAHLASNWAPPILVMDGAHVEECWGYEDELPGWNYATNWPDQAIAIVGCECEIDPMKLLKELRENLVNDEVDREDTLIQIDTIIVELTLEREYCSKCGRCYRI